MLYVALVISVILLLVFNLVAFRKWYLFILCAAGGLGIAIFVPPYVFGKQLPVAMLNAFLLVLVAPVTRLIGRGAKYRLALTLVATLLAYGYYLPEKLQREAEIARIVERNPFVSMEGRVPLIPASSGIIAIKDINRLDNFEEKVAEYNGIFLRDDYARGLKMLHDHSVQNFVESWGAGIQRMPPIYEDQFAHRERNEPSPLQPQNPAYRADLPRPLLEWEQRVVLHNDASLDFLYAKGFGYFKDRQHVAGFRSHRFKDIPTFDRPREKDKANWEVARLELVSLLMHKEPWVYVSDRLPQMDALKGVPTRPLDPFESDGLAALRKGEDLYVREDRMLGSIRSTKQCISCHGGDRGVLLGAFTYTIRPAK